MLRLALTIATVCWLCFTSSACHRSPIVLIPASVDIYGFVEAGEIIWKTPVPARAVIVSEGFLLEYRRLISRVRELERRGP